MQLLKNPLPAKQYFALLMLSSVLFLSSSCAKKMTFGTSSVVPAANGSVKIKKDKNKNYSVSINVENLAPSDKLSPPKNVYVVWMTTESNGTKNIGQFNSSSGFLSSKLKASLETVTSFKPTGFFITGEDNSSVTYPGTPIVLNTN